MPVIPLILSWLASSVVIKAIITLGVGTLVFSGYAAIISEIQAQVATRFAGLGADTLAYLNISGATYALGILLTAGAIRAALVFMPRLGVLSE